MSSKKKPPARKAAAKPAPSKTGVNADAVRELAGLLDN